MPVQRRQRIPPTDDWEQLQLLTTSAEQRTYELIRPVVLFGQSPAERARETGAPQRTLYRQVARFATDGMASLFARQVERHQRLPLAIRDAIRELKTEHPALNTYEITTICWVRFGHRPSSQTVKRVLAEAPLLHRTTRRYPLYHQMVDPAERRLAIIRLHSEGWNKQSIAAYLEVNRDTVHATLKRWVEEGVAGLENKSTAPRTNVRKTTLETIRTVKELQENPELGAFRIHAALRQIGIHLSPRTCGRILARNRKLYGLTGPTRQPHEPKPMPFKASRRHQYWTVDLRYLDHHLDEGKIYGISILENYSRAVLASGVFPTQDLTAYLMVLFAALRQHGVPEALVSDSGGIFRAKQACQIYEALGITKLKIDRRQAWQSYIETNFNVQRRMADWDFARATTWGELLATHDQWVVNFNYQSHWAHQQREDGRRSPAEVLSWVAGRVVAAEQLHRIFYRTRFGRTLDKLGYVRFRHWRIYGEQGLATEHAAVWLYGETLTIEFAGETLSQYRVRYQPGRRQLREVDEPRLFETPFHSPQLPLWELGDQDWLKVMRLRPYQQRGSRREPSLQQMFFA
jgi:transposase